MLAYLGMRLTTAEKRSWDLVGEAIWFGLYGGLFIQGAVDAFHGDYVGLILPGAMWVLMMWFRASEEKRLEHERRLEPLVRAHTARMLLINEESPNKEAPPV